jgi:DNA-binding GntR family transcriptional regulator
MTTVVPAVRAAQDDYCASLDRDDGAAAVLAARRWHEALIENCGNETVRATVGMLATIWSSHLRSIAADTVTLGGHISPEHSRRGAEEHDEIIRLIADGDSAAAGAVARRHLRDARVHAERPAELDATVSAATMRDPRALAP